MNGHSEDRHKTKEWEAGKVVPPQRPDPELVHQVEVHEPTIRKLRAAAESVLAEARIDIGTDSIKLFRANSAEPVHTIDLPPGALWEQPYSVLDEVADERASQDEKWGEQNHPDGTGGPGYYSQLADLTKRLNNEYARAADGSLSWQGILKEEVYEAFAESDPVKLRTELVQVAAVAVAWIEAIDRRASQ